MRCKDVVTLIEEMRADALPQSIHEHVLSCPACAETFRNLRLLRAGFHALAEEQAPEASLRFATRVMRRLDDALDSGWGAAGFIEKAGRRFVLATSLLATLMLLAVVLPATGPVREPSNDEPYLAQPETSTQSYNFLLADSSADSHGAIPVSLTNGSGEKQK